MRTGNLDFKAQVLSAANIVELIGRSVALKRRGKDYVGLCPFHQEKTPSFHVSPGKQYFHCYGCKAGGNAIDFVMKRDRLEFIDALKALGRELGLEMPAFGGQKEKAGERQLLLDANSAAAMFFEKLLTDESIGAPAREYLAKRKIDDDSIKRFRIGVAPNAWDGLLRQATRKYPAGVLHQAGLVKAREGGSGHYDTFRNRLMFPIRNESGQVIAFGGRVMPGSEDPAKYLNSPETPLFNKSRTIYGLDLARQRITETRTVAVVEGYTDVVMAHQYGATNVVSVLGTAMTEQHVAVLRRFADRIVLMFDADTAGDTAVNRAVGLFLSQPLEIAIASIPDGLDPDEFLIEHGAQAFEKLLSGASDALSYRWKLLAKNFEADDLTSRQKAVDEYLTALAAARESGPIDSLRWGMALTRVSRLTEIPVEELNRRFKVSKASAKRPAVQMPQVSEETEPTMDIRPAGPLTAQDRAERWVLGALLSEPNRWYDVQQSVMPQEFTADHRRRLAEVYWNHCRGEGTTEFHQFLGVIDDPALGELAIELVNDIEQLADVTAVLNDAIKHFESVRRKRDEQKTSARLIGAKDQPLSEQDEISLLQKLYENAGKPDPRRIGPRLRP